MPKCVKCYKGYRVFLRDDVGLCLNCFLDEMIDAGDEVQIFPSDYFSVKGGGGALM